MPVKSWHRPSSIAISFLELLVDVSTGCGKNLHGFGLELPASANGSGVNGARLLLAVISSGSGAKRRLVFFVVVSTGCGKGRRRGGDEGRAIMPQQRTSRPGGFERPRRWRRRHGRIDNQSSGIARELLWGDPNRPGMIWGVGLSRPPNG